MNFADIVAAAGIVLGLATGPAAGQTGGPGGLVPAFDDWSLSEAVKTYSPETLFEYINGAAEAYIGYDFRELAVAQYKGRQAKGSLTVEIYDMGSGLNAFGIYGAERFAESRFLPLGVQGYLEEGSLNFFHGRYYVKLLAFETGAETEAVLRRASAAVSAKAGPAGGFPAVLSAFPRPGLVVNSEKFILRNVLGLEFLAYGFTAEYKTDGREFSAFIAAAASPGEAAAWWSALLGHFRKGGHAVVEFPGGARIDDPYLRRVVAAKAGIYLCGVTGIREGGEAAGEEFVSRLARELASRPSPRPAR